MRGNNIYYNQESYKNISAKVEEKKINEVGNPNTMRRNKFDPFNKNKCESIKIGGSASVSSGNS